MLGFMGNETDLFGDEAIHDLPDVCADAGGGDRCFWQDGIVDIYPSFVSDGFQDLP